MALLSKVAQMGAQLVGAGLLFGLEHHQRQRAFAPFGVGDGDHRAFADRRVAGEQGFQLSEKIPRRRF